MESSPQTVQDYIMTTCEWKDGTWWLAVAATQIRENPARPSSSASSSLFIIPGWDMFCLPPTTLRDKLLQYICIATQIQLYVYYNFSFLCLIIFISVLHISQYSSQWVCKPSALSSSHLHFQAHTHTHSLLLYYWAAPVSRRSSKALDANNPMSTCKQVSILQAVWNTSTMKNVSFLSL